MRAHNFSAGPSMLPEEVLRQAQEELLEWRQSGQSVMEMSHRGKDFLSIYQETEATLRRLLNLPANYKALFLQGGGALQFSAVPMNLLSDNSQMASYVNTGEWATKALKEAGRYGQVHVAASSEGEKFNCIPPRNTWQIPSQSRYLHITSNETINGTQFHQWPESDGVPLVADMSSDILSRPLAVERFALIYAGAQKNFGPSGLTLVLIREDFLGRARADTPQVMNYKVQAENDSMYNTPPTFAIYLAGLVFQWIVRQGGLAGMAARNEAKAGVLYDYLDNCGGFYRNLVKRADRSQMNVPFVLSESSLNEAFLKQAEARRLLQLKGHRSVGGMRASLYNAMTMESVTTLIDFMKEFAHAHGQH